MAAMYPALLIAGGGIRAYKRNHERRSRNLCLVF